MGQEIGDSLKSASLPRSLMSISWPAFLSGGFDDERLILKIVGLLGFGYCILALDSRDSLEVKALTFHVADYNLIL